MPDLSFHSLNGNVCRVASLRTRTLRTAAASVFTALAGIAGWIGGGGGDLFPVGEWRTEINRKFSVAARLARSDGVAIGIFQGNRAARLSGTGDGFAVR